MVKARLFIQTKGLLIVLLKFYSNLFKSESGNRSQMVETAISTKVTDLANDHHLTKLPSAEEIHFSLMSIHPDKAPGTDSFSANFFKLTGLQSERR